MRTPVRAAAAVSLVLLTAACGGGQQAGGRSEGPAAEAAPGASAAPATPSAPARKVLTLPELEEAIVGQGDLPGYAVGERKGPGIGSPSVTVDKEACKPLADALYSIPHHLAFATAETTMTEMPKAGGATAPGNAATDLSLSSYEADGAREALAAVRTSASACRDGFTFTVIDETTKVRSVAPLPVAVGDEALAWTITLDWSSGPHLTNVVLFRVGGTVAVASTTSGAPGGIATPPQALLDAQAAKLS